MHALWLGTTAIICATALILYALSLGIDGMLLAGGLSGIFGVAAGGGAYQFGQSRAMRKLAKALDDLKEGEGQP